MHVIAGECISGRRPSRFSTLPFMLAIFTLCNCMTAGANAANGKATSLAEGIDMSDAAHSSKADPDYEVVFPVDRVNVMTITISPEHWIEMYENMTELDGEFGTNYGQIPSLRTRMSRVALLE